jgi:putative two-component system response regulator
MFRGAAAPGDSFQQTGLSPALRQALIARSQHHAAQRQFPEAGLLQQIASGQRVQAFNPAQTIQTLLNILADYDPETAAHSQRVADSARLLGQRVGLSEAMLHRLHTAALLHDIGKIGLDHQILMNSRSLTPPERVVINEHVVFTDAILRQIDFGPALAGMGEIAAGHHERWDGQGYPKRIHSYQIPLETRILTIADVYDAMTSKRSYHPAIPPAQVQQYLRQQSGQMFDPQLVQVFLASQP